MPGTIRLGALLALLAAVVALPGCGSDEISGEIPADDAIRLNAALDGVSDAIASQDCETAGSQADEFVDEVNSLPAEAGEELKAELRAAGEHLGTLVSDECLSTGTTETTNTQPTTEETTPTTTEETETPTTTEETQTTTTTTTTEENTPDEGGDGPPGDGPPGDGGTGGTGGPGTGE